MGGTKGPESRKQEVIRTFICIEIPESIKAKIDQLQDSLRKTVAPISWTKPANVHLTLKFLGAVPASRIERVGEAVERAARDLKPFQVDIAGTGCFPSIRNPRVLWVGFASVSDELKQLYNNIEDQLERQGFPREKRKFSPHLTIGRVRAPHKPNTIGEELVAHGFEPESFEAAEVIVMRSDLKPTGSIYTPQAVITLG